MARAYVEGLRDADPITFSVLAQDLIRKPLVMLDPRSVCDLLALAESDKITGSLSRDLRKFKDQMIREVSDLPDDTRLGAFLADLLAVAPERVPQTLRDITLERACTDETPIVQQRFAELEALFAATPPTEVKVREKPAARRTTLPTARAPRERRARSTAAARPPPKPKDSRRAQWIREDVLERLSHYGSKGIKQSILVAGAIHRSPYNDLGESEVVAVLKGLKTEGRINLSSGRWSEKTRW